MANHLHLKSLGNPHDEALLATMTHMVETHPNARITMASVNVINVEGNGLGEFLNELVKQVPVLGMRVYKSKRGKQIQSKHRKVDNGLETHSIHFTFHNLEVRERMGIPPTEAV